MTSPGFAGCAARERVLATVTPASRPGEKLAAVVGEPLVEALRLAATAPSGHNVQPWLVLVRDSRHWSLALAPDRRLPAVDPADHEALLGIGAFLENLVTAAAALGFEVEVERHGRHADDAELAALRIQRGRARGGSRELRRRRTNRRPFARRPVAMRDIAALVAGLDGFRWYPAGSPAADDITEILAGAALAQARRDDAQAELAAWLRYRAEPAPVDGLTPESLELRGAGLWLARHWPGEFPMSRPFRDRQAARLARLAANCGGWLLLSSPDGSVASMIDAGRRLERLLLRARGLGLGIHPMSQALQEPGWRQDLERATGTRDFPRVLLRVGYAETPAAGKRPRLPPEAFTHLLC